jgi:TolB-like protein/DNA-binding winged helix-turn-helix (wHTH) protein/Tfp pilus assembly protein PilF
MDLKRGFRLGLWEVSALNGEMTGPAGSVHLEPKVMEVLLVLAERPGEVVERDELLRRVWGARAAVSDEPLTRCIAELRRALGDSRQAPTFIQTVAKRGYRLLTPVTAPPSAQRAPPQSNAASAAALLPETASPDPDATGKAPAIGSAPSAKTDRRMRDVLPGVGAVAAGILSIIVIGSFVLQRPVRVPVAAAIPPNTIAVLPFTEGDSVGDEDYFGEGLADEILNRLSAVDGLRVVARTSSFAVRSSTDDVRSIAERLRVAHVLEGTVRRSGKRVRVSARLVDAERGYQTWAATYEGVLGDIFKLQDALANTIVAELRKTVPTLPAEPPFATPPPTTNLAAYELLLRGRQYLNRRDEEPLRRSIRLFREAIDLDPSYGHAYVELAKAYALLPSYSAELQDEMFDEALATLANGIDQSPEVDAPMQSVVALIAQARWDWITAKVAFQEALEHAPNDPDLLVWYSQFLASVGQPAASLENARRARESDLLSPVVNHRLFVASLWMDADADAARYASIAEELGMGPTSNPDSYIVLKLRSRDYAAVRPLLIGVQTMFARSTAWVDPLLEALASADRRPAAIAAVATAEQARDIPRKYLFGAWLYLDERDRALAAALELVNDRPSFNVEFIFSREARALRAHPRFGELIRAIGLDRYWDQFGWPEMCEKGSEKIVCH